MTKSWLLFNALKRWTLFKLKSSESNSQTLININPFTIDVGFLYSTPPLDTSTITWNQINFLSLSRLDQKIFVYIQHNVKQPPPKMGNDDWKSIKNYNVFVKHKLFVIWSFNEHPKLLFIYFSIHLMQQSKDLVLFFVDCLLLLERKFTNYCYWF